MLFIIQAAMETMTWPVAETQFCTVKEGEPARLQGSMVNVSCVSDA